MLESRIILPDTVQLEQDYELTGPLRQTLQLWSPRRGEIITVKDATLQDFRARIAELSIERARIHIVERGDMPVITDRKFQRTEREIILHQALPEKERMEWIIQKATELGARAIIPFKSKRSVSLEERDRKQKKALCWPRIALRAAKQCRRPDIPQVFPFCTFQESLHIARQSGVRILLWEKQGPGPALADFLGQTYGDRKISIMVGPEGGFTEDEVDLARQEGFEPIHLGPRILRTETASLVIISIIQFVFGDLR
jgi:16S rRNA (uracil1498-N3)-methyltransferase